MKLREAVAQKLGFNSADVDFVDGRVRSGNRSAALADAARDGDLSGEDAIEYGDLAKKYQQSTFSGHFVEIGADTRRLRGAGPCRHRASGRDIIDEVDPISSPMKAKGIGELGLYGVGAAIANAIYNATGVRVRDYPITLDKLMAKMPTAP